MTENILPSQYFISSFYKFIQVNDLKNLQNSLQEVCKEYQVLGTVLLSPEGINGSLAGKESAIYSVLNFLMTYPPFQNIKSKFSRSATLPFKKLKITIKKEIITLRQPNLNVGEKTGCFIPPDKWNELISDPEVLVVDLRNNYETALGTFKNAVDPNTEVFTEFPKFFQESHIKDKNQKIAMFCTGGIRCEKASAYLLSQGFENVYQLQGGILNYLELIPKEESLWQGKCFIFDNRGHV